MSEELVFASYAVFKALPDRLASTDREVAGKELDAFLSERAGSIETRGVYSTVGFRADADLMFWWVGPSADEIQRLIGDLRKTQLGAALEQRDQFVGLVRPAEFAKDHLPAFVRGEEPKPFICVYPFVRTPEWYLLAPEERGALLREHGTAGREYPDVLANTTSSFGLGDWEWILAFEADGLDRIVELIRRLRGTEARRYTKVEIPFYTGIKKDPVDAVALL